MKLLKYLTPKYKKFKPKAEKIRELEREIGEKHTELIYKQREIEEVFRKSTKRVFKRKMDNPIIYNRKAKYGHLKAEKHKTYFCPKGL